MTHETELAEKAHRFTAQSERDEAGFISWLVIDTRTGEAVADFDTKREAEKDAAALNRYVR